MQQNETSVSFVRPVSAAVVSIVLLLGQVVVGFLLVRAQGLELAPAAAIPALAFLMRSPIVCLGIACLVNVLAHAVGLFLQQERPPEAVDDSPSEVKHTAREKLPLYPGYVLVLIVFAVSALAGLMTAVVTGVLLLVLLAYDRIDRRRNVFRALAGGGLPALGVLLGAAAGGWQGQISLLPELLLSGFLLGGYAAATEPAPDFRDPRFGRWRWIPVGLAAVGGAVLLGVLFFRFGVAALSPWLGVWLFLWLLARTVSLTVAVTNMMGQSAPHVIRVPFQRGQLLLQALLGLAFLPAVQGWWGFLAVFLLLPVAGFFDRR